jgi:hypothetical protein
MRIQPTVLVLAIISSAFVACSASDAADERNAAKLEASLRKSISRDVSVLINEISDAAQALQRVLAHLDRLPTDDSIPDTEQQILKSIYHSEPTRNHLVYVSRRLLHSEMSKKLVGQRKEELRAGIRLFRVLGTPKDLSTWQIGTSQTIDRYTDEGLDGQIAIAEEIAKATWDVCQRGETDWAAMSKTFTPFTFVWAFHNHKSFRPTNWPVRMRSAIGTSQPVYQQVYALNHTPLPLKLTGPLDESSIENLAFLIMFAMRNEENSAGSLLPVQLAAVKLAGRTGSLYFAPTIKNVLDKTSSDELRRVASTALAACTRPVAVANTSELTIRQLALDSTRIDEIFEDWKADASRNVDIDQLKSLVGLDYGDNRDAWLLWWERDQQSRKACRNGERNFLYRGRVLDDQGRPIVDATVSVSVSGEFTYQKYGGPIAGWVNTDRQGRYLIRSGFSKYDRDRRGVYPAIIEINKPGYHFVSSTRLSRHYVSEYDLTVETLIQIDPNEVVHPGEAVEADVVLRPAAQVKVSVTDAAARAIMVTNIEARWTELNPEEVSPVGYCGCCDDSYASSLFTPVRGQLHKPRSVWLARAKPDQEPATVSANIDRYRSAPGGQEVAFYFSQFRPGVSRQFAIYASPEDQKPTAISNAVSLPAAGTYRVQLTWNPQAPPERQLHAEVSPEP